MLMLNAKHYELILHEDLSKLLPMKRGTKTPTQTIKDIVKLFLQFNAVVTPSYIWENKLICGWVWATISLNECQCYPFCQTGEWQQFRGESLWQERRTFHPACCRVHCFVCHSIALFFESHQCYRSHLLQWVIQVHWLCKWNIDHLIHQNSSIYRRLESLFCGSGSDQHTQKLIGWKLIKNYLPLYMHAHDHN